MPSPSTGDAAKNLVVKLLKTLDTLLIAVTFQIIAVSLYQIFSAPIPESKHNFLHTLRIDDFYELKVVLVQIAVVILVILILEQAVEVGATMETLYFGLSIGAITVTSVWAWKNMAKH